MKQPRQYVIQELLSLEFIAKLKDVDVILGVDEETGNEFLLFGRSTLRGIVASSTPMDCAVARQSILQESDELEALIAAVRKAKGYDEYEDAEPTSN